MPDEYLDATVAQALEAHRTRDAGEQESDSSNRQVLHAGFIDRPSIEVSSSFVRIAGSFLNRVRAKSTFPQRGLRITLTPRSTRPFRRNRRQSRVRGTNRRTTCCTAPPNTAWLSHAPGMIRTCVRCIRRHGVGTTKVADVVTGAVA